MTDLERFRPYTLAAGLSAEDLLRGLESFMRERDVRGFINLDDVLALEVVFTRVGHEIAKHIEHQDQGPEL